MKLRSPKRWQILLRALLRVDAQDLVEYALLIALLAFGATAGFKSLANGLTQAFSNVGTYLATNTA